MLGKVLQYMRHGKLATVPEDLKPYFHRAVELSIESDCLMWGIRVVVPAKLRKRVLEKLHIIHMDMNKMKLVARSFMWWPLLDNNIKQL